MLLASLVPWRGILTGHFQDGHFQDDLIDFSGTLGLYYPTADPPKHKMAENPKLEDRRRLKDQCDQY
jgi:hypothetical protein